MRALLYPQPRAYLNQRIGYLDLMAALLDKGADPNARLRKKVWYSGYSFDLSGVDEIGAEQAQSEVPGQIYVETASGHNAELVDIVESVGHEAMVADQYFEKGGKMFAAESKFRSEGQVRESGVIDSAEYGFFAAAPMGAGVESEPEPIIEIVGGAEADAARIPFQAAAQGEQGAGELAVDIGAGIKDGVSAEQLPLRRRRFLRRSNCGEREHDGDECGQHRQNPRGKAL